MAGTHGRPIGRNAADGLVFDGFYGSFDLARIQIGLESKAIAGFAAIPTATYIAATLRRAEADTVDGVLHRGALKWSLRRELESKSAALQKSQVQYEHIKDVFGRYVVPDVVDEILKHTSDIKLGGEIKDVSIMFTDIRGFRRSPNACHPQILSRFSMSISGR